jgi:hypothetical protein
MHIIPPTPAPRAVAGIIFAEDFDDAHPPAPPPVEEAAPPPRLLTDEDVARAREEGFAAGFQAGCDDGARRLDRAAGEALQQLADRMQELADRRAAQIGQTAEATARVMIAALAALLPSLVARHSPSEIEPMVRDILAELTPDCAIAVAVAPELLEAVRSRLAGLPRGQARRVALRSDDALPVGDARLTWEGGAASRRAKMVVDSVTDILRGLDLLPPAAIVAAKPHDKKFAAPEAAVETEDA